MTPINLKFLQWVLKDEQFATTPPIPILRNHMHRDMVTKLVEAIDDYGSGLRDIRDLLKTPVVDVRILVAKFFSSKLLQTLM